MKGGSNMALFAIGDLHLGFGVNKTMDKFGEEWKNHIQKIEKIGENVYSNKILYCF